MVLKWNEYVGKESNKGNGEWCTIGKYVEHVQVVGVSEMMMNEKCKATRQEEISSSFLKILP